MQLSDEAITNLYLDSCGTVVGCSNDGDEARTTTTFGHLMLMHGADLYITTHESKVWEDQRERAVKALRTVADRIEQLNEEKKAAHAERNR